MKKKKVLFIDLDGTLIHTASGKTFPEGVWDMNVATEYTSLLTDNRRLIIKIRRIRDVRGKICK